MFAHIVDRCMRFVTSAFAAIHKKEVIVVPILFPRACGLLPCLQDQILPQKWVHIALRYTHHGNVQSYKGLLLRILLSSLFGKYWSKVLTSSVTQYLDDAISKGCYRSMIATLSQPSMYMRTDTNIKLVQKNRNVFLGIRYSLSQTSDIPSVITARSSWCVSFRKMVHSNELQHNEYEMNNDSFMALFALEFIHSKRECIVP